MTIVIQCHVCGKNVEIAVEREDFYDWQDGGHVQNTFPYLSADDREMFISRTCGVCWDEMFSFPDFAEDQV